MGGYPVALGLTIVGTLLVVAAIIHRHQSRLATIGQLVGIRPGFLGLRGSHGELDLSVDLVPHAPGLLASGMTLLACGVLPLSFFVVPSEQPASHTITAAVLISVLWAIALSLGARTRFEVRAPRSRLSVRSSRVPDSSTRSGDATFDRALRVWGPTVDVAASLDDTTRFELLEAGLHWLEVRDGTVCGSWMMPIFGVRVTKDAERAFELAKMLNHKERPVERLCRIILSDPLRDVRIRAAAVLLVHAGEDPATRALCERFAGSQVEEALRSNDAITVFALHRLRATGGIMHVPRIRELVDADQRDLAEAAEVAIATILHRQQDGGGGRLSTPVHTDCGGLTEAATGGLTATRPGRPTSA